MRTFVAIDIPEDIQGRIATLMDALQRTAAPVRWSRPDGLHITLKFIGESKPEVVEQARMLLASLHLPAPADIAVRGAGYFPSERSPRVIWLGIHAGPQLAQLAAQVEQALSSVGIPKEARKFSPHLTLGRVSLDGRFPGSGNIASVQRVLAEQQPLELGSFSPDEYFLYESKPARGGSVYHKIARFPLSSPPHGSSTV